MSAGETFDPEALGLASAEPPLAAVEQHEPSAAAVRARRVAEAVNADHERVARYVVLFVFVACLVGLSVTLGLNHGAVWGWLVGALSSLVIGRSLARRWTRERDAERKERAEAAKVERMPDRGFLPGR